MRKPAIALRLILLAAVLAAPAARAEGVFAREGYGEWIEGYDLRGETLGSTGIGLIDPFNFTLANPAATAFATTTLGCVGLGSDLRRTSDGGRTAHRAKPYFASTGLHLALPSRLGVRLALRQVSDPTLSWDSPVTVGSDPAQYGTRRETGTRGLVRYEAGLCWRGGAHWGIGANLGVLTGSLRDETQFTFGDWAEDQGWADGTEMRRLRFRPALNASGGLLVRPVRWGSVGGFVSSAATCTVEELYRGLGGGQWSADTVRADLPLGLGAGAAVELPGHLRLSGDLVWRRWEQVAFGGPGASAAGARPFRNTLRWGLGLERVPVLEKSTPVLASIRWRAGFARIPWYLDGLAEWRLSVGAGIPIQRDRGTVDLMLAYGRRGSVAATGLEETYLRLGLGATFARVLREY
jgi:hypothetical protein